ncbi:DUF6527 family protein [uncultured Imperialibacter sp.]|uniref:DUF6527 family protein n=1 Tax=uncultured Imperialibacter sp. TaxID=1672639 RepID=UPI0030DBDB81|tara:strand:- start:10134 stop:10484 length:351 start_codon:yes stop_codon:yes gene_type:complete
MRILRHKFIDLVPEVLEDEVLYISIEYCAVIHKCVCGCGNEVVTPLSPTDWELTFNGKTVSLSPSIGNWNFECKSHYWIRNNKVKFARKWSDWEIEEARKKDAKLQKKYYRTRKNK